MQNTLKIQETIIVSKDELEKSRKALKLLESDDYEIIKLGFSIFESCFFYNRYNPETLFINNELVSIDGLFSDLKANLKNCEREPNNVVYFKMTREYSMFGLNESLYNFDKINRHIIVDPLETDEINLIKELNKVQKIDTCDFSSLKTIMNCKDLYFGYDTIASYKLSEFYNFEEGRFIENKRFAKVLFGSLINSLVSGIYHFYRKIPVNIIVEE